MSLIFSLFLLWSPSISSGWWVCRWFGRVGFVGSGFGAELRIGPGRNLQPVLRISVGVGTPQILMTSSSPASGLTLLSPTLGDASLKILRILLIQHHSGQKRIKRKQPASMESLRFLCHSRTILPDGSGMIR